MRCIFCLEERPPSDEHVFPLAIGGTLHTDRVCAPCNSLLGNSVDAALCNHVFTVMRRWQLKLPGNSGSVPDGLKELLGEGVLVSDPNVRLKVTSNPTDAVPNLRMLYSVREIELPDGSEVKQIIIDAKDAKQVGTIIERERKRAGAAPLSKDELNNQIAAILAAGPQTIERPQLRHQVGVDLVAFHNGLLKIAYELAFLWLGESYIDDPMAAKLRDVILSRTDEQSAALRGTITFGSDIEPLHFWADDRDCHVAYCMVADARVAVCLKIFDVFSAVIAVSEEKDRYLKGQFDADKIRFIHIDPVASKQRESSFLDEIGRISASMIGSNGL